MGPISVRYYVLVPCPWMTTWWGSWMTWIRPLEVGKISWRSLEQRQLGTTGYWGPTAWICWLCNRDKKAHYNHQMSPCPYPAAMSGQNIIQSMINLWSCARYREKERESERETERGRGRLDFTHHDDATFQCIALHNIHAAHFTSHIG